MSQVYDLDGYADAADRLELIYAAGASGRPGAVMFVGVSGPSGQKRCYVVPAKDGGFECYAPGARVQMRAAGAQLTPPVAGVLSQRFVPPSGADEQAGRGLVAWTAPPGTPVLAAGEPFPPMRLYRGAEVVYLTEPLDRPGALEGATYKLKFPGSEHAIYITINDIVQAGQRRPFEVFINSKNMEHFAWTVALTRMISAVFRRGGDVSFVVEELKAVFDPRGGAWIEGRYVPSILAAIGGVIERHMVATGFLQGEGMDATLAGFASTLPMLVAVASSPLFGVLAILLPRTKKA